MTVAIVLITLSCSDYTSRCPREVVVRAVKFASEIQRAAQAESVPELVFASLVWHESGLRPGARSRVGSIGLAQLHERGSAVYLCRDAPTRAWRTDNAANLRCGARVLHNYVHECGGKIEWGVGGYNSGNCVDNPWTRSVVAGASP